MLKKKPLRAEMEGQLTDKEKEDVEKLVRIATERQYILDSSLAQRFLLARKGNLGEAFELFKEYIIRFGEEDLLNISPDNPTVKEELLSGKYCLPGVTARDGTGIVIFRAKFHTKCGNKEELHSCLQAIFFCLSYVLSTVSAQRHGVTFVFDMTKLAIRNVDTSLMKSMLTLLKNAFPGRLAVAFMYNSPRWFRAISTLLRPFVKKKMMERVKFIKNLTSEIDTEKLPDFVGGKRPYDGKKRMDYIISSFSILSKYNLSHQSIKKNPAVSKRISVFQNQQHLKRQSKHMQQASIAPTQSTTATTATAATSVQRRSPGKPLSENQFSEPPPTQSHSAIRQRQQQMIHQRQQQQLQHQQLHETRRHITVNANPATALRSSHPAGRSSSLQSQSYEHLSTEDGSLEDVFVPYVVKSSDFARTAHSLLETGEAITHFSDLQLLPRPTDFTAACDEKNRGKNRYRNILPYDFNRVKLQSPSSNGTDYINASYIDGYSQPRKFIASQGPLEGTVTDFWQMVWENNCPVIAMVAQVVEDGRMKCFAYWEVKKCGPFSIEVDQIKSFDGIQYRRIVLHNTTTNESRSIHQLQFISWPDHGIPDDPSNFLYLRSLVREYKHHSQLKGPILVHCSAGVGRTGTFITIDSVLEQLSSEGRGNVFGTINKLRDQRPSMVQTPMQYLFCYQAVATVIDMAGKV
eukprot:m.30434 g.30434  ORF g.30434 m.30434 type:complete len:690 (-) comp6228_c0_seq2:2857-4926(-)